MRQKIDIYDRQGKLDSKLNHIKAAKDISNKNKKALLKYHTFQSTRLSVGRMQKELCILTNIFRWLKKDCEELTRDDAIGVVNEINKQDYAEWTKCDYRVIMKKFFKWYLTEIGRFDDEGDKRRYPKEVCWIETTMKNSNNMLPEEVINEDDVRKLIDAADHPRDKALIFTLFESGCRIGELATLKIKHVQIDKFGAVLIVSGKTGDRRIRIIASKSLLTAWLDIHPDKNNAEAPLWVGIGTKNKNAFLKYSTIGSIFKKVAKKAKIKKRCNPHAFRHGRATMLAKFLTDAQMKEFFGWTRGSDMAAVYVHLSGRDLDDAILNLYDKKPDTSAKPKLIEKICVVCKTENSPTQKFCMKCGNALDLITAIQNDQLIADSLAKTVLERLGIQDISQIKKPLVEKIDNFSTVELSKSGANVIFGSGEIWRPVKSETGTKLRD